MSVNYVCEFSYYNKIKGNNMKFETFGLNVARQRIKRNISAYEFSLRVGKDPSYMSKLENGKINPSLKMIIAIANEFNIDIRDLFVE